MEVEKAPKEKEAKVGRQEDYNPGEGIPKFYL
jgi:hypothetical protein